MLNFSTINPPRDLNNVIPYNRLFQQKKTSNAVCARINDVTSSNERSLRSSNNTTSSEDIRSFCGSASEVFSRPGVFHLPSHPPSVVPTEADTTAHINPSNPNGFGRTFFEPATRVPTFPKSKVVFETQNEVQELYTMGTVPSFGKQSHRGTTNPWRKYGALRKLHEIGGIAPPGNTRNDRKNKNSFVEIKKGTRPPQPPRCAEVTLNKDRKNPGLIGRFRLPRNIPAEQLSQAIAWEIKSVAESEPSSMPPTPPSITQPADSVTENNSREWTIPSRHVQTRFS
ncbi:hypothetical protein Q1695_004764 [Nippostrongylus brasiliensis]|nr:hypothetical protein Q1695_004764 [Nippostrongylus brasiliensis]